MPDARPRFVGAELYFNDLKPARAFYERTLGLELNDEAPGHYVKLGGDEGFVCLERKGSESYRSHDKAVLFSRSRISTRPSRRSGKTGSSEGPRTR